MPDLMAPQISVPSPSDKTTETKVMKNTRKIWETAHDKPHIPKPVQEKKRTYFLEKGRAPDPPKQKAERPPATYTNSKSPFGIYDELKKEWK